MERPSSPDADSGGQNSSFIMMLLLVSGFVALIGLIYIYGDFSQRKSDQIAGVVRVQRSSGIGDEANTDTQTEQSQDSVQEAMPLPLDGTEVGEITSDTNPDSEMTQPEEVSDLPENAVQPEAVELPAKPAPKQKTRNTSIFFVRATDSGHLSLKGSSVEIDDRRAPLTTAIQNLLKGPSQKEKGQGVYSLVPEGSRLLAASVKNGVAYLDFNEDFRFNPLGTDGYQAQLQQIVYTATEFPSVKSVQILLEGKQVDYLHEGIYVGTPLTRESFR
ncbi:MAG: GerMN domain-containing protein [Spirochaetia bacterium]